MRKKEIFLKWLEQVFNVNSWYSISQEVLSYISRNWDDWEYLLYAWGLDDDELTPEEFRNRLENLEKNMIIHIGEKLQYIENEICKKKLKKGMKL